HKGSGGHTGIIAGSADRPGAAYLSALGALKAGAGLVTLISERKVTEGVVRLYPEIMTREADYNNDSETYFSKLLSGIDSLVIGPGLSEENTVLRWVKSILTDWNGYLVLDAEAFRITGDMRFDAAKTVITPHPVELARLMNIPKDEIQRDRIGHSIRCAQKLNTIVLLKGARSIIAKPSGDFTINMSGNRFMASGGMGDLLSGMTGALMYQTKSAYEAARIAAYLHGLASDIAIENGKFPLNATLVADYIKEAMINSGIYV
ncbi:MAG: NAD(P)H-hydrate dehydratase, partial [Deltaproteobacteria bacterium]|nr:NAD(P)H-hydrate dehydratase [Deltaproteobacteria bacterium]